MATVTTSQERGQWYNDRAAALLRAVVGDDDIEAAHMADALVVQAGDVADYCAGRVRMPLERQLCLALFVVAEVPRLARAGHRLRAQVGAAIRYGSGTTAIHAGPPERLLWADPRAPRE